MYLPVDVDFPRHPKSVRLSSAIGNPVGWGYMVNLWAWAAKFQPDGELGSYEPAEIEAAAGWSKADGKLYAAAVRVGFIDEDEAGKPGRIHRWMERTGADLLRMKTEAERSRQRKAAWRERQGNADVTRDRGVPSQGQAVTGTGDETPGNADGTGMSSGDKTRQDQARQGKQDPDLSLPSRGSDLGPAGARSNGDASPAVLLPPHQRPPIARVAAVTPAFLSVFEPYPRQDGKQPAAQAFQEIAESYPGGEAALAASILAAYRRGFLKRHPYAGPNATRPMFDKVLAERRWEDPASAPDNEPTSRPASRYAEVKA